MVERIRAAASIDSWSSEGPTFSPSLTAYKIMKVMARIPAREVPPMRDLVRQFMPIFGFVLFFQSKQLF